MSIITREMTVAGHVDRVVITRADDGWKLREERDDQLVREVRLTDWHRVERAVRVFETRSLHEPVA
jgi:hypothetical protein